MGWTRVWEMAEKGERRGEKRREAQRGPHGRRGMHVGGDGWAEWLHLTRLGKATGESGEHTLQHAPSHSLYIGNLVRADVAAVQVQHAARVADRVAPQVDAFLPHDRRIRRNVVLVGRRARQVVVHDDDCRAATRNGPARDMPASGPRRCRHLYNARKGPMAPTGLAFRRLRLLVPEQWHQTR